MTCRCVYRISDGRLISIASIWVEPLPAGMSFVDRADFPPNEEMWDETTKAWVARPPKILVDRLEDIKNHPRFDKFKQVWQSLNAARKQLIVEFLTDWLGQMRWRTNLTSIILFPEEGDPDA